MFLAASVVEPTIWMGCESSDSLSLPSTLFALPSLHPHTSLLSATAVLGFLSTRGGAATGGNEGGGTGRVGEEEKRSRKRSPKITVMQVDRQ